MFDDLLREREVRKALRAIARQRVALVHQPSNFQVIERGLPNEEWFQVAVRTAEIRGWVAVLHQDMPTGKLQMHGNEPQFPSNMTPETHYKLTEGGWAVLNRSHAWVLATFMVSGLGLAVSVAALVVAWMALPRP
jgi:hypothetical protein